MDRGGAAAETSVLKEREYFSGVMKNARTES
jgi:hypothetical protein